MKREYQWASIAGAVGALLFLVVMWLAGEFP